MTRQQDDCIKQSRLKLQNPYAYLAGDETLEAIVPDQTTSVHDARRLLQNQYAYLDEHGGYSEYPGHAASSSPEQPIIDVENIIISGKKKSAHSRREIEHIVRKLHHLMWNRRSSLLLARQDVSPHEILDPELALLGIGYSIDNEECLGQYSGKGELFEVAGIVDNENKKVQISRRFSPEIRNFTAAHELGHAILHERTGLHRDRALDGSSNSRNKDNTETEANIFAAFFLMPERQVRPAFERIFLTQTFSLNEKTAFALTAGNLDALKNKCSTLRDLTRILASAKRYNGTHLVSLAKQFNVSIEAMAIRIEELELATF